MILIVGGEGQGKLNYALSRKDIDGKIIVNQLHIWIKLLHKRGIDPNIWIDSILKENQDSIIICNEVGCGIVPISKEERGWRELTGRISCRLAKEADEVWRLICGIPMCIKRKES